MASVAALGKAEGPWVVIDGYHASWRATGWSKRPRNGLLPAAATNMRCGRGLHLPQRAAGFGARPPRPVVCEFDDLTLPPGMIWLCSRRDAVHGANLRSVALYRFNAVGGMLARTASPPRAFGSRPRLAKAVLDASPAARWPGGTFSIARWKAACALSRLPQSDCGALVRGAKANWHHRVRGEVIRTPCAYNAATCRGFAGLQGSSLPHPDIAAPRNVRWYDLSSHR